MAYRNGVYVAFDGNGEKDPSKSDLKYYILLKAWSKNKNIDFTFSDSHKKTFAVKDSSSKETLRARLRERMKNSKNMLLILSSDTNWDRGELNYEIELAIDEFEIPIIIAYTDCEEALLTPKDFSSYWPKSLKERIDKCIEGKTDECMVNCIHIPFKKEPIFSAISQFSINDDTIDSPIAYYSKNSYDKWGIK